MSIAAWVGGSRRCCFPCKSRFSSKAAVLIWMGAELLARKLREDSISDAGRSWIPARFSQLRGSMLTGAGSFLPVAASHHQRHEYGLIQNEQHEQHESRHDGASE